MTWQADTERLTKKRTYRSLVSTFFHQIEELLSGAMVTVLLIQFLYCGQQLIDDGLQLCAAYCLWRCMKKWSNKNWCFTLCVCVVGAYILHTVVHMYSMYLCVPGSVATVALWCPAGCPRWLPAAPCHTSLSVWWWRGRFHRTPPHWHMTWPEWQRSNNNSHFSAFILASILMFF